MVSSPHKRGAARFWTRWRATFAVCGIVLVFVVLGAEGYLLARSRRSAPAKAVTAIATAAMRGDAEGVAASIDTSAIANNAVDEVLSDSNEHSSLAADYLSKHPGMTEDQLKAKVATTIDAEIRKKVESGSLSKRVPFGNDAMKALVAEALAQGAIQSQTVEGDVAHAVVAVPYKGKVLSVRIRMQRTGDTWKVDEVENLADVLNQAGY